jgi:NTP pyrophosphatase (non-canonical NTP hydrolase)
MNQNEYLLICLMEECAEISEECAKVAVRVSKILRFGPNETQPGKLHNNIERLSEELADLLGTIETLIDHGIIERESIEIKKKKIENFINYSKQCQTLQ